MHARCIHDNCFVHAQDATDEEDSSSDADKEKKKEVCLHTHAQMHFVCIECIDVCIGVCISDALNTPCFHITTALEALREPVLSRKCGSSSVRVTSREAGLVIYVSSSSCVCITICILHAGLAK